MLLLDLIVRDRIKGDGCVVTLGRHGFLIYDEGRESYRVSVHIGGILVLK